MFVACGSEGIITIIFKFKFRKTGYHGFSHLLVSNLNFYKIYRSHFRFKFDLII